jgi:hypothetical protein
MPTIPDLPRNSAVATRGVRAIVPLPKDVHPQHPPPGPRASATPARVSRNGGLQSAVKNAQLQAHFSEEGSNTNEFEWSNVEAMTK